MKRTTRWARLLVGLCLLAWASPVEAQDDKAWNQAVSGLQRGYENRDAAVFEMNLKTIARDDSRRAVTKIMGALDQATDLDVYDLAIHLMAGMRSEAARVTLKSLAGTDTKVWEQQNAALDVVSRWKGTEQLIIDALSSKRATIRRQAMSLIGLMGSVTGLEKMIEMLTDVDDEPKSVEHKDLRAGLAVITGKKLAKGYEYKLWWEKLDFLAKEQLLARIRRRGQALADGDPSKPKKPDDDVKPIRGSVSPLMKEWKRNRPDEWKYMTSQPKKNIIVVQGVYDKVQNVLKHLGIPHTVVGRDNLGSFKLDPKQILIFNCTYTHKAASFAAKMMLTGIKGVPEVKKQKYKPALARNLTDGEIRVIRNFVLRGGFLFTSDWELKNVLKRAFPEYVGIDGATKAHNFHIDVTTQGAKHALMRGVFSKNPYDRKKMRWHIDKASYLIKNIGGSSVIPLVTSGPLKDAYGNGHVAVTFTPLQWGTIRGGVVLHVMSHFQRQYSGKDDQFALQKMLLNFIALKRTWKVKVIKRQR